MRVLVVDVAAQYGGALSVLNDYLKIFSNDTNTEYFVVVGTLNYDDRQNIHFIKAPFVKKSAFHRLYFDNIFIKKLIRQITPDYILSLQNKALSVRKLPQEVLFHNALFISEKRYRFAESRMLWVYQNVISRLVKNSLKKKQIRKIYVQAEWIKCVLSEKWKIDRKIIEVKKPTISWENIDCSERKDIPGALFYPANGASYKNHITLLKACTEIWDEKGLDCGLTLYLTGHADSLSAQCKELLDRKEYPVVFVGRLTKQEMAEMYKKTALVFPSYIETVGLPIPEAKSFGCQIIVADCAYSRDAVGEYERVRYFNAFDEDKLKKLIIEFINNEGTCLNNDQ